MKCLIILVVCAFGLYYCIEHDFNGFDDSILFGIKWPGEKDLSDENLVNDDDKIPEEDQRESLLVSTINKETYSCLIPKLRSKETVRDEATGAPSPLNLLKPLFTQKICSYRLENFWSYEVCHGRYIKQYHEEREGKQVKTQEYFLGHWDKKKQNQFEDAMLKAHESNTAPKTTKVEGFNLPYVEVVMTDGTICDLNGLPRSTRVLYVCYAHGKHEVYSFKEFLTCEYEFIILSPLLCDHPQFKPKDVSENIIECSPLNDAPKKPRSLLKMEADSFRFHHQTVQMDKDPKDVLAVLKVEKIDKDGETHLKFELHPFSDEDLKVPETSESNRNQNRPPLRVTEESPVRAFLKGEYCLTGGTGWWKYEFCYGKHVMQYHIDRNGEKTSLLLGTFNEQSHMNWISYYKEKAPKPIEQRTSVSHLYAEGDLCEQVGAHRETEVKLKCLENSSSPDQVSLYLLEPKTCQYILGVESPLICDLLPFADDNGLIKIDRIITLEKKKTVVVTND